MDNSFVRSTTTFCETDVPHRDIANFVYVTVETFDENQDMVFIFIAIYLGASTCSCYGIIIQKKIMDNQFIYPYKIICLKGIIGMIISAILIVISTLIPCKNNQN